jgi:hypothetical protein
MARSVGFSEDDLEAASGRHSRRRPGGLTLSFACLCVGAHEQKNEPPSDSCSYDGHNATSSSRSGRCCPVPSHPFGDFKDKPAQCSEADGLGFPLFERKAHGVELTFKGNQFLRHARKILADVAEARGALRSDPASLAGRIALGVTPLVAGYVLAEILARFRRAFPAVSVEIAEDGRGYLEHLGFGNLIDVKKHERIPLELSNQNAFGVGEHMAHGQPYPVAGRLDALDLER